MPANLNPGYFVAEKKYKEAKTREDRIAALQEMLSVMPKHKGTDHLQGDIKRRIAHLKEEGEKRRTAGPKRQQSPYIIPRAGAGQVAIIGPPSSGKSSIVGALSNAPVKIGEYPFSTTVPVPGMATFDRIRIQLVDTPPIAKGAFVPDLADLLRRADLTALVLSAVDPEVLDAFDMISTELAHYHLELIEDPEGEYEMQTVGGGVKTLGVLTHMDTDGADDVHAMLTETLAGRIPLLAMSVGREEDLLRFCAKSWAQMKMIRVFSKQPGKKPDLGEPFYLHQGGTVMNLAEKIHQEIAAKLRYARVWGAQVHDGQSVQKEHTLHDGDIVEIHA